MSDRMFASEGDSVDVGRQHSSSWDRWSDRSDGSVLRDGAVMGVGAGRGDGADRGDGEPDDAAAGITRRLQGRVDRQRWLLDRMRSDPLQDEPAGLSELLESARRMRRDTESLLLLQGQDPGVRPARARRLSDVLGDAAGAAEEPRRVELRSGPAATVAAAAAVELLHVLAELVDHVAAVYPGARVDVSWRVESPGGVAVEVRADGATRHDPDGLGGRLALGAAQRLARRSRCGIVLRTPTAGTTTSGPVASVHCPGTVITVDAGSRPWSWSDDQPPAEPPRPSPRPTNGVPTGPVTGRPADGADELFGPLLGFTADLTGEPAATPIFEAIASAWFREDEPDATGGAHRNGAATSPAAPDPLGPDPLGPDPAAPDPMGPDPLGPDPLGAGTARNGSGHHRSDRNGAGPRDWETPSDTEWRAAAERAARSEPETPATGGLPRRRPGTRLVPPSRGGAGVPEPEQPDRAPDRVRDRLSTYQRGLREGRHRAPATEPDQDGPAAW